ncbi:MAG: M1 family aminopeptidase [Bacteroidota bacterium]
MMFSKHVVVVGFFLFGLSSCGTHTQGPDIGISKDLAELRKNQISEVSYNLDLEIPKQSKLPIKGSLSVRFVLKDKSQDLILDFDGADSLVYNVISNGNEVRFETLNGHLIIPKQYLSDKCAFDIEFNAGDQALNRKDEFMYSLFVPANASSCFPVLDQPNIKGRYKLSLTVPNNWTAFSNESAIDTVELGSNRRFTFAETPPISSYLFAFTAGDFKSISKTLGGREYIMLHRESDSLKVNRNVEVIFDWHHRSMTWLEDYTEIDYPFNKFGFVLLPSFQFGGMEHPGAIFYKASSLFLEDSHSLSEKKSRARLIAHETAHMWFGDLVTMDWFNDVWLKEVFANFMAAKITQPGFPQINHDLQFLLSYYPGAYEVDRTQGSHPIQQPLNNLKDAGSLYGNIIYQKSPVVMRMLEENMSEESFKIGIREYLKKFSFGNATWDDLVAIMSEHTDYNLDVWNDQWVRSAGMPHVRYNLREREDSISKFTLFTVSNDDRNPLWWPQKLKVEVGIPDSSVLVEIDKSFRVAEVKEVVGLPSPNYIFNNAGGLGYGYFDMKQNSRANLLKSVVYEPEPLKRAAIWINLHESVIRGKLDPEDLIPVQLSGLSKEGDAMIIDYLLKSLQHIYLIYLNDNSRSKYTSRFESVLVNKLVSSGPEVRKLFFDALKRIAKSDNTVELLNAMMLNEVEMEGLVLSERDRIGLAFELCVRNSLDSERLIDSLLNRVNDEDLKSRLNFVKKAVVGDHQERMSFFENLKEVKNRNNEEWVLEALEYIHHPLRVAESQTLIAPSLELLVEIKQTGDIFFPKRWLDRTLGNHQSAEALDAVKQFLYKNNNYPVDLKNKILQSSDHLFRSVNVREKWFKQELDEKVGAL